LERFNGRIEDVLQSHHSSRSGLVKYILIATSGFYNSSFRSSPPGQQPLQAMKDWHKLKPELFKKQP